MRQIRQMLRLARDRVSAREIGRRLGVEPPGSVTHWTGRAMAAASNLSLRTVQRIWNAHRLQPHRVRTFKRSTDSRFAAKLDDVVGGACKRLRSA